MIPAENIVAAFQGSQKTVFAVSKSTTEAQVFLEVIPYVGLLLTKKLYSLESVDYSWISHVFFPCVCVLGKGGNAINLCFYGASKLLQMFRGSQHCN